MLVCIYLPLALFSSDDLLTAIAFQLLQAGNAFKPDYSDSTEVHALNHGLGVMATVLNDVLDFESQYSLEFF